MRRLLIACVLLWGCHSSPRPGDGGDAREVGAGDAPASDRGVDLGAGDAQDAVDATGADAGIDALTDAGIDAAPDGAQDAGVDAGAADVAVDAAEPVDVGPSVPLDDWEWMNPRPSGASWSSVWFDGTRAWAVGQAGAAIHSSDGVSWAVSPKVTYNALNGVWGEGDTVWAVGEKGTVLGSRDGGRTFSIFPSPTSADLYAVWGAGGTVFAVGDLGVVLRGDAGSFRLLSPVGQRALRGVWGRSVTDVWVAGGSSTVYHSTDGETFASAGLITTTDPYAVSGDASNVWVVGRGGWGGYARYDGTQWITDDINPGVAESFWGVWAASPTEVFCAGDRGRLWRTTDDLTSRRTVFTAPIPWQLTGISGRGDTLFVVGGAGTLYRSDDRGVTFTSGAIGRHAWDADALRAIWALDEEHMFVAGAGGQVWRSTDAGLTWTALATGVTDRLNAITGRADGTVVASGGVYAGYAVLIRSRDFGEHWTRSAVSPRTLGMVLDGNDLWAASDDRCTVSHSTDLGDHWETFFLPSSCISTSRIWASGPNVIASGEASAAWYSGDKGLTWRQLALPSGALSGIWAASATELWGAGAGRLLHSTDGGATWESRDPGISGGYITGSGSDLYVASSSAVFASHDAGQSWRSLPPPPQLTAIWAGPTHLFGVGFAGAIVRQPRSPR